MVIENFNDDEVMVTLETKFQINAEVKLVLPKGSKVGSEFTGN